MDATSFVTRLALSLGLSDLHGCKFCSLDDKLLVFHRPFVEYKGIFPPDLLQIKSKELEKEANALILTGGKVGTTLCN